MTTTRNPRPRDARAPRPPSSAGRGGGGPTAPSPLGRFLERIVAVDTSGCTAVERARLLAGAVMLLVVALLATASGALFAHDLLGVSVPVAVIVGFLWGGIVLCLDRVIVLSLDNARGAGRIATAVLRLAMAALLGWVVAEPFVLRVFDKEVRAEMVSFAQAQSQARSAEIAASPRYGDRALAAANQAVVDLRSRSVSTGADPDAVNKDPEVVRLQNALASAAGARREQQAKVECESDGTCGTGRAGDGPEWQRKLDELRRLEGEVARLESDVAQARRDANARLTSVGAAVASAAGDDLAEAKDTLATITVERKATDARAAAAVQGEDGLGARMDALGRLRTKRPSIGLEYLLITGILVVVDTSAVAIKLMQRRSAGEDKRIEDQRHQAALDRMWRDHERVQCEVELQEDAAMQAGLREVYREFQEECAEKSLEDLRRLIDSQEPADADLIAAAADELAARLRRRSFLRGGEAGERT